MDEPLTSDKSKRIRASKLYQLACEKEKAGAYEMAVDLMQQSLELYEDEIVLSALLKLISCIGPK